MKKKLLAMLLAVVMVCGVSGCGKDKTDATDGQQVTAELDGEILPLFRSAANAAAQPF